jgi:hypothetical protein
MFKFFMLIIFSAIFAQAQVDYESFTLLHKNIDPIKAIIDDIKDMSGNGKYVVSPLIKISVCGSDLILRKTNDVEEIFKKQLPGFFRGKYNVDNYNYVFEQRIKGYKLIHFINDILLSEFVDEIKNNKPKFYYIFSQISASNVKNKTIYGIVADFQTYEE